MNYTKIFNEYDTSEGVPFYILSKRVNFPEDDSLEIYSYVYSPDDTPWTIMSYQLYGSINYWWVLTSLNYDMPFYANRGSVIKVINPKYLNEVLKYV